MLRDIIKDVVNESKLTLTSQNANDLMMAINWLRLNGLLHSDDKTTRFSVRSDKKHIAVVSVSHAEKAISAVKSRFGVFVNVEQ